MKRLMTAGLIPLLLLGLSACETPVPSRKFPEIGFSHHPTINLNVREIRVDGPPAGGVSDVDSRSPVSLSGTAKRWGPERLRAVGQSGVAVVRIEEALFTEERLKRTGGLRGVFTTDQTDRYEASVKMSVSVEAHPTGRGIASASARRARTVAEGITLADREKVMFDLIETVMRDIDRVLDAEIRKHLDAFIVR